MKAMKQGDLAFFYASGGKKGRAPGITGIMEVVREAEPDMGAFDENNPYFVENVKMRGKDENPRWYLVHVEYRKKLAEPVTCVHATLLPFADADTDLCYPTGSKSFRSSRRATGCWLRCRCSQRRD